MSGSRQVLFAKNLICVCINGHDNAEYQGAIYHQYADDEVCFESISDFLLKAEELFDQWDFPQRGLAQRFFKRGQNPDIGYKKKKPDEKLPIDIIQEENGVRNVQNKKGELGTFVIQVVFRQDATWQGHVIHQESNSKMDFESAMELVRFMDKALDGDQS